VFQQQRRLLSWVQGPYIYRSGGVDALTISVKIQPDLQLMKTLVGDDILQE
jgi:hypothetical protein